MQRVVCRDNPDGTKTILRKNFGHDTMVALQQLRQTRSLCDIVLKVPDGEIQAHRNILIINSDYFRGMLTNAFSESRSTEIELQSGVIDRATGELLVTYMYTGQLPLTSDNVQALIMASDLWQMYAVKNICVDYMGRLINMQNCWGILEFSQVYNCKLLSEVAAELIRHRFPVAVQSPEFLRISHLWIYRFISNFELILGPEGEDAVAKALVRWLEYNQPGDEEVMSLIPLVQWAKVTKVLRHQLINNCPVLRDYPARQGVIAKELTIAYKQERNVYPKLYVIGGYPQDRTGPKNPRLQSVERRDYFSSHWTQLADFPMLSCGSFAFSIKMRIYCCAYEPITTPNSNVRATQTCVYEYNNILNEWRDAKPYFSPEALALLDTCLQEDGAFAVCEETDVIYAVCSSEIGCISASVVDGEVFFKNFRLLPRAHGYMSEHVRMHAAAVLDKKLYVVGGNEGGQGADIMPSSKVIRFDPDTNQWQPCASMHDARIKHTATAFNGCIYACGGFNTRRLCSVECYNPVSDEWEKRKPMHKFRSHHQAVAFKEYLYVIGGKSFTQSISGTKKVLSEWESYTEDSWYLSRMGETLNHARCNFSAVVVRLC